MKMAGPYFHLVLLLQVLAVSMLWRKQTLGNGEFEFVHKPAIRCFDRTRDLTLR